MRKKRKRDFKKKVIYRNRGNHFIWLILLMFLFSLFIIKRHSYKTQISLANKVAYLKVPALRKFNLPEPLEIFPLSTTILGAETFEAKDIVMYVNIEREKRGAVPLKINPLLMEASKMRARVILEYQHFAHDDPYEGITAQSALNQLGYHYSYGSENIGMGPDSAQGFVNGFMNSTAHRENLLNPELLETGVAMVTGPYKEYYVNIVVQIFGTPANREEYLGYKKDDLEKYKNLIALYDGQLNPVFWTVNRILLNKEYSDERYALLKRQKEILTSIYSRMRDEKPLSESDLVLISEFNQNL